jgi:hypothetical protein
MAVTLTSTFRLPSAVTLTDKALMREIGLLALEQIRTRTRLGQDMHGQAFAPYHPGYAQQKAEAVGGSGTVNLTVSGDLLNALQVIEVTDTSVTLGWTR